MNTTKSSAMELALRDSQARLTGIIASAMDAIITLNVDQQILLFNHAAEKMFGYSEAQVLGQPVDLLLPERFRERHRLYIKLFGETGVTNRTMGRLGTLYGVRADGEEFPIEASISQVEAAEGILYTVILRDVTERMKAETKLIESEAELRATFEQAAVGIAHVAPDGRFLRVNDKLCEITGYTQEELLTKSFQEITHPDDLQTDLEMQDSLLSGRLNMYDLEKRYFRKDRTLIWIRLNVALVRDLSGSPKYMIKIIKDITQRKEAEAALQAKSEEIKSMTQQLWQTAKLATMGELAASIAHELNNPLAIVSLRIESLLSNTPEGSPESRELSVIAAEVDRMASLVANMLQFSRSNQRQISSLNPAEEVEKTLELVQTHLRHRRIAILREYSEAIPMIQADRQGLRQLFLNLFTNASDAMPEGGTLRIRITPLDQQKGIRIAIQDTGIGIRPEDQRQVMEPFFTTKIEGQGTGLGLAICRRIVEEHKGAIRIFSPGERQGSTVEVELPSSNGNRLIFLEE